MNSEAAINMNKNESVWPAGFVKLYPYGKVGLLFDGPKADRSVAEECFSWSLSVLVFFSFRLK
jgi:hypothetical protein